MKTVIMSILVGCFLMVTMSMNHMQEVDNTRKATVQKIDGFEIYVMSEPVRAYEIVGDLSVYDTGFGEQYIDDWVNKYVKKAKKLMEDDKNLKIDAIVYTNGKGASAIKFKEVK